MPTVKLNPSAVPAGWREAGSKTQLWRDGKGEALLDIWLVRELKPSPWELLLCHACTECLGAATCPSTQGQVTSAPGEIAVKALCQGKLPVVEAGRGICRQGDQQPRGIAAHWGRAPEAAGASLLATESPRCWG